MLKRGLQVILVQLLLVISLVSAEYVGFNPDTWNYNTDPYDKLNAPQVHQLDIAQVPDTKIPVVFDKLSDQQKQQLSGPQLSQIPDTQLGNLGQYNPSSLSQSLQSKGYDVAELRGDLNGATIQNQQITLADGSTYDLTTGKKITLEGQDGSTKYFSDSDNTVIINGVGIEYTKDTLKVQSADSIDYKTANLQKPVKFAATQFTFTVETADRVQIGTIKFDKIKDSSFTVQVPDTLITAQVTSAINNNNVLFPNTIAITPFFQIHYNQDQSFQIDYTKTLQETTLPEAAQYSGTTKVIDIKPQNTVEFGQITQDNGFLATLTFAPLSADAELILLNTQPFILKAKQGQLNYTTQSFIESITTSCQFTTAQYTNGFTLVTLSPFLEVLCPGAQYAYHDLQTKQQSFTIINTGKDLYELYLNKNNIWNLQELKNKNDLSWGFVDLPASVMLQGIVQYGRVREFLPQNELFEDYQKNTLAFMPAYQSFAADNNAILALQGKAFGIAIKGIVNPLTTTYTMTNSGAHKIQEQLAFNKVVTFHDYNKQPQFPPYLTQYTSSFQPLLASVEQQTLQPNCPETILLMNPATTQGNAFLQDLTTTGAIAYDSYLKKYGKSQN